jgi:hypothetical protein
MIQIFALLTFVSAIVTQPVIATSDSERISADQIINNPDSSVTFIHPWVPGSARRSGEHLEIRRGIPGACHLFGMDDFLRGQVVWSKVMAPGVSVGNDGTIGAIESAYYVESMTCILGGDYVPKITAASIKPNGDGSISISKPLIHSGVKKYPIVSGFSSGACRLLGYVSAIMYSQKWSKQQAMGVSLDYEGQIYDKVSGTYLLSLKCKDEALDESSSPERARFEERLRQSRAQS